jgi:hypothetical protein
VTERYELIIRANPGHWREKPIQRLKALLKALKRGYGFEAISVAPITEELAATKALQKADEQVES